VSEQDIASEAGSAIPPYNPALCCRLFRPLYHFAP
jgi:hypothetical protein